MKNKKAIMAFSALLIVIFHLWINITNFPIESYIRSICVIGVDIFFFISAYTIEKIETDKYKKFIINRFKNIYLKFIIFSIVGAIYLKWDITRLIKVITGVEFIQKGGGSFLWFLPAIMIVYVLLPLYKAIDKKYKRLVPFLAIILSITASIIISMYTNMTHILIIINRIPIILIGYYTSKYDVVNKLSEKNTTYWSVTLICLVTGIAISYIMFTKHLIIPWFKDVYYIVYIPLILGLILLIDKIKVNKITDMLGSCTLELYAIQMIIGFKLAGKVFNYLNNKTMSNIITILILVIISYAISRLFKLKDKFAKN